MQGWLKGGVFQKTPLELKILETPPPLEKFWNTPPSDPARSAGSELDLIMIKPLI